MTKGILESVVLNLIDLNKNGILLSEIYQNLWREKFGYEPAKIHSCLYRLQKRNLIEGFETSYFQGESVRAYRITPLGKDALSGSMLSFA